MTVRYLPSARSRAPSARQAISHTQTEEHESHTVTLAGSANAAFTH